MERGGEREMGKRWGKGTDEDSPVTAWTARLSMVGVAIISLRMLGSVVNGNPLSISSSNSCNHKKRKERE